MDEGRTSPFLLSSIHLGFVALILRQTRPFLARRIVSEWQRVDRVVFRIRDLDVMKTFSEGLGALLRLEPGPASPDALSACRATGDLLTHCFEMM